MPIRSLESFLSGKLGIPHKDDPKRTLAVEQLYSIRKAPLPGEDERVIEDIKISNDVLKKFNPGYISAVLPEFIEALNRGIGVNYSPLSTAGACKTYKKGTDPKCLLYVWIVPSGSEHTNVTVRQKFL